MDRSNRRIETLLGLALLLSAPAAARAEDWPMYGRDLKHSFTNSAALINASNVTTLLPAWTFLTGDAVSASPAIVNGVVYVGAWDGFFYALDANTSSPSGAMIWKFQVDCQSAIVALDAKTGKIRRRFEVDPMLDPDGKPLRGPGRNRGCGGIWSSGAVDERKRLVFFGTADCGADAPPPYHEAILGLRTGSLRAKWAYRPRAGDTCDFDFGASANVIDLGGNSWLGVGGKDGTYYILNRLTKNRGGELVWRSNVVFGGYSGGFIGSTAFDGQRVYGGTAFGELGNPNGVCDPSDPRDTAQQQPTMHAFDPVARSVPWEQNGGASSAASAVSGSPAVVFNGTLFPPSLRAFDAATGTPLQSFTFPGSVNSSR